MTKKTNRPRSGILGTTVKACSASAGLAALLLVPLGPVLADNLPSNPHEAVAFRLAQAAGQAELTPEERKRLRELREDRRDAKKEQREDRRDARKELRDERKAKREERREERKDAREQKRDERKDAREQKREERKEQRDDRRETRQDRRDDAQPVQRTQDVQPQQRTQDAPTRVQRSDQPTRTDSRRGGQDSPTTGMTGDDRRGDGDRRQRGDRAGDQQNAGAREGDARGFRATREERRRRRDERRSRGERRTADDTVNLEQLKRERKVRREGKAEIIEEPDSRRIIRSGDRAIITRDENRRMRRFGKAVDTDRRPDGGRITTIARPNGVRIVTETSDDGHLISRYRIGRNGHRHYLVDNRRTWRKWGAIATGAALATGLLVAIDPPRYRGPRDRYIIEYDRSNYDTIYDALEAPPISELDRRYSLDEVLYTPNLRSYMRRIDLSTVHFAFGSWQVNEDEYDELESLARAIGRIIDRDRDEVFLIEGHTDAVGDSVDNKTLSDRRAEEVANILTEEFDIPPENLVTQGYGEDFLKVDTQAPEEANRRVTVRRITPLLERRSADARD